MTWQVLVDDNFHYMDESQRYVKGEYPTYAEALDVCKEIVDRCLRDEYVPGMSASALYFRYTMFGDDPFIVDRSESPGASGHFSAWDYAKVRCGELCAQSQDT